MIISDGTKLYQRLPAMMRESWQPCEPLREVPVDRRVQAAMYRTWKGGKSASGE
jgi:hypothetical protein